MGIPQKSLVIGACEIACHYPELSLNDAAGDALQLAEKIRLYGIEENQKKETVFIAACRFVSADKDLYRGAGKMRIGHRARSCRRNVGDM